MVGDGGGGQRWQLFFLPLDSPRPTPGGVNSSAVTVFCPHTQVLGQGENHISAVQDWLARIGRIHADASDAHSSRFCALDAGRLLGASRLVYSSAKVWHGYNNATTTAPVEGGGRDAGRGGGNAVKGRETVREDVFVIEFDEDPESGQSSAVLVRPRTGLVRTIGPEGLHGAAELDHRGGMGELEEHVSVAGRSNSFGESVAGSFVGGARPLACPGGDPESDGEDDLGTVPAFMMDERILCTASILALS